MWRLRVRRRRRKGVVEGAVGDAQEGEGEGRDIYASVMRVRECKSTTTLKGFNTEEGRGRGTHIKETYLSRLSHSSFFALLFAKHFDVKNITNILSTSSPFHILTLNSAKTDEGYVETYHARKQNNVDNNDVFVVTWQPTVPLPLTDIVI